MKKKKILLVFTIVAVALLLVGCKKDNKYIKIGLLTSNEGLSNYAVGLSRNLVISDIHEGDRFGNKGEAREPNPDYQDWTFADDVQIVEYEEKGKTKKKYVVNGEEIMDESGENKASFSMSYNEVSNYVLFHSDPAELIKALKKEKQSIDVAFLTVDAIKAMYEAEKNLSESQKTNLNGLKVVYIETYSSDDFTISGFWVAKESYAMNSGYFSKFIRSLVKNNEFAALYSLSYSKESYETAYSNMENDINNSVDKNDKFSYFVYEVLGKTLKSTKSADPLKYGTDVNSYISCLQYTLKPALDSNMKYENTSYFRTTASAAYLFYNGSVFKILGDAQLLILYNEVFKGHTNYESIDDVMYLDEMFNQQYLMQYYKCTVEF